MSDWQVRFERVLDAVKGYSDIVQKFYTQLEHTYYHPDARYELKDYVGRLNGASEELTALTELLFEPKFVLVHLGDIISVQRNGQEVARGVIINIDEAGRQVLFSENNMEQWIMYSDGDGWYLENDRNPTYDLDIVKVT
jgi:biotin-(acetyl-CoA carboxylase) ligase